MPTLFSIGSYKIYFWSNEGNPLEPVHVHVAVKTPSQNATKIWLTEAGGALLCHNNSKIPQKDLSKIMDVVQAMHTVVVDQWRDYFGAVSYYC